MTLPRFDFRNPAPLPAALGAALQGWSKQACHRLERAWADMPFAPRLESSSPEILWAASVADSLPENSLRFRAARAGSSDDSLLVVPRPLLVALVGGLLGEPLEAAGLDRPLTLIEDDVADLIAKQRFLEPLQQAWPLPEKLLLEPPRRESPQAGPAFTPRASLLVLRFKVRSALGEWDWWWMLPRAGWLDSCAEREAPPPPPSRAERIALLKELPLKVTVHLGTVGLPLLHLAALQAGDVLLLDQPIDRPLPASVAGQVKLLVWPGASGNRQAVAVDSLVESKP
ncbi:MAG: FliM/FliN family flagellar motor switch protein [Gemmataceae bacterium]|nr:FliM/FliN family flagellar motor switch protein [Gemmataceae bacterium]